MDGHAHALTIALHRGRKVTDVGVLGVGGGRWLVPRLQRRRRGVRDGVGVGRPGGGRVSDV